MKTASRHLRQLYQQAMTVRGYLHGDSTIEPQARRSDCKAGREKHSNSAGRRRGLSEFGAEPRDPLETSLLGGDRDEYIDKSFWHDAEAEGVTFDESRVDGRWDEEDSSEPWK